MTHNSPDYHSDDFASARHANGSNTSEAWKIADGLGLEGRRARNWTQGFIHAKQGRCDLIGMGASSYDAGYAAASKE